MPKVNEDQVKQQDQVNAGTKHHGIPSTESAIIPELDAEPSPRPWQWLPNDGQFVVDARGNLVSEIPCQGCNPLDGELIVRAVNAHDALDVAAMCTPVRCGTSPVLPSARVGCGQFITSEPELYRCVQCTVPFHRECLRSHFGEH